MNDIADFWIDTSIGKTVTVQKTVELRFVLRDGGYILQQKIITYGDDVTEKWVDIPLMEETND